MKKTTAKVSHTLMIEHKEKTTQALQALLNLPFADPHARKMIELALKGLDANVTRMTPEEIFAYLGRQR